MATTYLSKTFGTPTDRDKWTWSGWIKKTTNGIDQVLFSAYSDASNYTEIRFDSASDALQVRNKIGGSFVGRQHTNRQFRDPAAFYHIVIIWDSGNASAGDRMKMYVNGVEETSFANDDNPTLDADSWINYTVDNRLGALNTSNYFTGQMAHVHFCDGQAYAASEFGETDSTSGIWIAKTSPSVTYGDNGYFMKFVSGATGTDSSGQSNTMSVSGTLTSPKDNPDNNFCTFNPLDNYYQASTFANGNNTITQAASNYTWNTATIGLTSGKWYWECKGGTNIASVIVAICSKLSPGSTTEITSDAASITMEMGSGGVLKGGVSEYSGTAYTTSNVCGIAMDLDNNKYYLALDNVWKNSGVPTSGATGTGAVDITTPIPNTGFYFPAQADPSSSAGGECFWNFGNGYFGTTAVTSAEADGNGEGAFEYAPPTGYFAICTNNLGSES